MSRRRKRWDEMLVEALALARDETITIAGLVEQFGVPRTTARALIRDLEEQGLLEQTFRGRGGRPPGDTRSCWLASEELE